MNGTNRTGGKAGRTAHLLNWLVKRRRVIDRRADWADIQNVAVGIDVAFNDLCYRCVHFVHAARFKEQRDAARLLGYGIGGGGVVNLCSRCRRAERVVLSSLLSSAPCLVVFR